MRIRQIDLLRGLAALLVTVFHITGNTGVPKIISVGSYGWVGVEMFFVISGFILPYSMHKVNFKFTDSGTFLLKRIARIYPAYIVTLAGMVFLTAYTNRSLFSHSTLGFNMLFMNAFLGVENYLPVSWTLFIEFQFYLLIVIIYPIIARTPIYSLLFVLILSSCCIWAPANTVFEWFPFFGLGVIIFNRVKTNMPIDLFTLSLIILGAIIQYKFELPHLIAGYFSVGFIMLVQPEEKSIISRALLKLGMISYSLYLVHWEVWRTMFSIAKKYSFMVGNEILLTVSAIIVSIFSAYVMYFFAERPWLPVKK